MTSDTFVSSDRTAVSVEGFFHVDGGVGTREDFFRELAVAAVNIGVRSVGLPDDSLQHDLFRAVRINDFSLLDRAGGGIPSLLRHRAARIVLLGIGRIRLADDPQVDRAGNLFDRTVGLIQGLLYQLAVGTIVIGVRRVWLACDALIALAGGTGSIV